LLVLFLLWTSLRVRSNNFLSRLERNIDESSKSFETMSLLNAEQTWRRQWIRELCWKSVCFKALQWKMFMNQSIRKQQQQPSIVLNIRTALCSCIQNRLLGLVNYTKNENDWLAVLFKNCFVNEWFKNTHQDMLNFLKLSLIFYQYFLWKCLLVCVFRSRFSFASLEIEFANTKTNQKSQ
jgi:hypothetical protein